MAYVPEDKEDVEEDFSSKGITPATQEKGANDREQMINNALVHLKHNIGEPGAQAVRSRIILIELELQRYAALVPTASVPTILEIDIICHKLPQTETCYCTFSIHI
jgi:hypothetical protein